MKNLKISLSAAAIFALAACSNDEVVNSTTVDPDAIRYSVTTNNATRALTLYSSADKPSTFNVWACLNDAASSYPTYFQNQVVSKTDDSDYTAQNAHYWPDESQSLNFTAITAADDADEAATTEADVAVAYAAGVLSQSNVKMPSSADNQIDMLYAVSNNLNRNSSSSYSYIDGEEPKYVAAGYVPLNFRHALAQLAFKAVNKNKSILVRVDEVRVCNIRTKDNVQYLTYATADGSTTSYDTQEQYTSSDDAYSYNTCQWQNRNQPYSLNNVATDAYKNTSNKTINYSDISLSAKQFVPYYQTYGIPQSNDEGDQGEDEGTNNSETEGDGSEDEEEIQEKDKLPDGVASEYASKVANVLYIGNMLLIPQKFSATDLTATKPNLSTVKTCFLLKCTIQNVADPNTYPGGTYNDTYCYDDVAKNLNGTMNQDCATNGVYIHGSESATKWVLVPIVQADSTTDSSGVSTLSWEPGKKYTYTFIFNSGDNGGIPVPDGDDPEIPTDTPTLVSISTNLTIDNYYDVAPNINQNVAP